MHVHSTKVLEPYEQSLRRGGAAHSGDALHTLMPQHACVRHKGIQHMIASRRPRQEHYLGDYDADIGYCRKNPRKLAQCYRAVTDARAVLLLPKRY